MYLSIAGIGEAASQGSILMESLQQICRSCLFYGDSCQDPGYGLRVWVVYPEGALIVQLWSED